MTADQFLDARAKMYSPEGLEPAARFVASVFGGADALLLAELDTWVGELASLDVDERINRTIAVLSSLTQIAATACEALAAGSGKAPTEILAQVEKVIVDLREARDREEPPQRLAG